MDPNNKCRCHPSKVASWLCDASARDLWSISNILFVLLLYIVLGFTFLFSIVKGMYTITSMRESFFYEKVYLSIVLIYIWIFLICYIWTRIAATKLEKKQNAKPLQCYLGIRLKVLRYVDNSVGLGVSWMEEVLVLVQRSIINNLKGCKEEDVQNLHEARTKVKELYNDLFKKENSPAKNEMIKKALYFTLKIKTIRHPADLQGKRRCYIIIGLLSELMDSSIKSNGLSFGKFLSFCKSMISAIFSCLQYLQSFTFYLPCRNQDFSSSNDPSSNNCLKFFKSLNCYLPCNWKVIIGSCLQYWDTFLQCFKKFIMSLTFYSWDSSTKKYSTNSILIISSTIFLFTVIPFIADNITDIGVLVLYWDLWSSSGERNIYKILFSTKPYGPLAFPGTEIFMPLIYLSMFFGVSIFLAIFTNPFKKISSQFKTQIKMKTSKVEENEEVICPSSIIQRYDLPTDESSLESPSQCILQFGIYFSLVPLIRVLQELQLADDLITKDYNAKLKFMENFALSGVISIFAITMGQVKKNLIFQEFNISWKQWGCYFLASMMATMFYISGTTLWLVVMLGTNFQFVGLSSIVNINSNCSNLVTDTIFLIVFATICLFACPIMTLITCSKENKFKIPASRFSWLTSIFNASLPTSQHITRGYYNIYHNSTMKSPHLLHRAAEQAGASLIIACLLLCFASHEQMKWSNLPLNCTDCIFTVNTSIIVEEHYNNLLPKATISLDLKNYITSTLVIIPVCGFFSYVFLWAYFSMDNGFFNAVETDYYFHNESSIDNHQDHEDKVSSGENIKLLEKRVSNSEHKIKEVVHDDVEQNSSTDWIQNWIDAEAEEDWYWYLWRKLSSWVLKKKMTPTNKFDMTGSWMDLTGDDGQEEASEDGASVLNGEEGPLEYSIRMSFPFYWKQNREKLSSQPPYSF